MAEEYTDFRIRIGARQEQNGTYPLEAVLSDGSAFVGGELSPDR